MATLTVTSYNVRPRQAPRRARLSEERRERLTPHAPEQENHEHLFVLPEFSKDWARVQRAIAGDADVQGGLFAPYASRLYRMAFAVLRNKEDAEDAVQDGLCKAFTSLESFQGRSSLSTWLTSIVKNAALMALRRKKSRPDASLDELLETKTETLTHLAIDPKPNPEQTCAAGEFKTRIEKELSQLSPALRVALRLRITKAYSTAELGRSLGISAAAFKSRISRARRQLASSLQPALSGFNEATRGEAHFRGWRENCGLNELLR